MSNSTSNDAATKASPALDIIVSEEAATLAIQQPLLTHLYFGDSDFGNNKNTDQDCLSIQTELELLGSNLFAQYWFTDQQVSQAKYKNIRYAHTPQMIRRK